MPLCPIPRYLRDLVFPIALYNFKLVKIESLANALHQSVIQYELNNININFYKV